MKECERVLDRTFSLKEEASSSSATESTEPSTSSATDDGPIKESKELGEIEYMKSLYMKSTLAALRVLKEIRSGSSTVSAFSLPPLQSSGLEDTWNRVPVLEQAAK